MELKGICFAVLTGLSLSANAGNVLRLQSGVIETSGPNSAMTTMSVSSEAQDFIVQFKAPITEADKKELRQNGMRVFRYIPDDALIVRGTSAGLKNFSENGKVNGFVAYTGEMKLSNSLPSISVFSQGHSLNLFISTFTAEDSASVLKFLETQDGNLEIIDQSPTGLSVKVDSSLIPSLAMRSGIEFIEELQDMQLMHITLEDPQPLAPVDPAKPAGDYTGLSGYETGTKVMNFDSIWAQGFHGENQIGSMADTGLDSGNIATLNGDFTGGVTKGYIMGIGARDWSDPMGHGTHVAGSVISRGGPSGGKFLGGAYKGQLIPQGMWSPIITNLTVPPKLAKLFDAAFADGARVHTNSWGAAAKFGVYDSMAQQADQFMWDHPDFLAIFAAGNSGVDKDKNGKIDPNSVGTPGTAKNVLTVGASENLLNVGGIQKFIKDLRGAIDSWPTEPIASSKVSDNINGVAMFSSRGPTVDGRLKPEIVAPGTNILSARSHVPKAELLWGEYNGDYLYSGGTSMATPLTAGAAMVTRQVLVEKFKIANPSAALIKAMLMHSATDMFPGQYGSGTATQELQRRPNNDEGYGRVDMKTMSYLTPQNSKMIDNAGVAQGETFSEDVVVNNGTLLVNLVYTDAPGTPAAAAALVNNLDLTVVDASGKVYGTPDKINNNEVVELKGLSKGTYKIRVAGTSVPMGKNGKQPFALAVWAQ